MRFFVTIKERQVADPQERVAMCRHRLKSLAYQEQLLASNDLAYGFRSEDGQTAVLMFSVDSLEHLDLCLKRDPLWPYSETEVVPVVSTRALVEEAQDYLNEEIISKPQLEEFDVPNRVIDNAAEYWLAYKEVRPFSPLLPDEEQNDVHRRTVRSQIVHLEQVEFADDNPVGKAVGILISEATLEATKHHIETCEVFPDTVVQYTRLLPIPKAIDATHGELLALRRPVVNTQDSMENAHA